MPDEKHFLDIRGSVLSFRRVIDPMPRLPGVSYLLLNKIIPEASVQAPEFLPLSILMHKHFSSMSFCISPLPSPFFSLLSLAIQDSNAWYKYVFVTEERKQIPADFCSLLKSYVALCTRTQEGKFMRCRFKMGLYLFFGKWKAKKKKQLKV